MRTPLVALHPMGPREQRAQRNSTREARRSVDKSVLVALGNNEEGLELVRIEETDNRSSLPE